MKFLTKHQYPLFYSVALMVVACSTGCSNTALTNERLDPVTSVTVRYSEHPLVFFRPVSGRSTFAKDYVNLAPVEINRSGDHQYYIWLGISMADGDATARDEFESVIVSADDMELQLVIKTWTTMAIGASQPIYSKPFSTAVDAYYEVSVEQLQLLAEATELRLHTGGGDRLTFEPWNRQERSKAALMEFVTGPTY